MKAYFKYTISVFIILISLFSLSVVPGIAGNHTYFSTTVVTLM